MQSGTVKSGQGKLGAMTSTNTVRFSIHVRVDMACIRTETYGTRAHEDDGEPDEERAGGAGDLVRGALESLKAAENKLAHLPLRPRRGGSKRTGRASWARSAKACRGCGAFAPAVCAPVSFVLSQLHRLPPPLNALSPAYLPSIMLGILTVHRLDRLEWQAPFAFLFRPQQRR
jgi:hypothetical protein